MACSLPGHLPAPLARAPRPLLRRAPSSSPRSASPWRLTATTPVAKRTPRRPWDRSCHRRRTHAGLPLTSPRANAAILLPGPGVAKTMTNGPYDSFVRPPMPDRLAAHPQCECSREQTADRIMKPALSQLLPEGRSAVLLYEEKRKLGFRGRAVAFAQKRFFCLSDSGIISLRGISTLSEPNNEFRRGLNH